MRTAAPTVLRAARLPALPAALLTGLLAGLLAALPAFPARAASGETVTVSEMPQTAATGKTVLATTAMNTPPHKLCAIVQDYGAYGRYMPNTRSAVVVAAPAPGQVLVDMTLDLPLGKVKRYRLQLDAQAGPASCQLSWKLVPRDDLKAEDTIGDTSGYWKFTQQPANEAASVVEYFVYADPGPVPFGLGWIVDMMSKRSLPATLEALRGEAQRREAR
jgi:hypothetical protein